MSLELVFHNIL